MLDRQNVKCLPSNACSFGLGFKFVGFFSFSLGGGGGGGIKPQPNEQALFGKHFSFSCQAQCLSVTPSNKHALDQHSLGVTGKSYFSN